MLDGLKKDRSCGIQPDVSPKDANPIHNTLAASGVFLME
jgi:hypothetical protein